ncbi:MAG: tetratricopeptide repeat protein [Elusimicrobiota bacterium]|jgi:tetratricopeptide (TPR) repeat protein
MTGTHKPASGLFYAYGKLARALAAVWERVETPQVWFLYLGGAALLCGGIYFGFLRYPRMPRPSLELSARPRIDAAIAAAQERLKSNPQDIAALVELGSLHFEKGPDAYPDAINELEDARRLGALDVRIFYCLGVMYQELALYPFALEEYQRYLRNQPEDKEVRMLAAKLYFRQGDFAAAINEFERLKFSDPDDALVCENLGLSLLEAKLLDRAVENFKQVQAEGGLPARRAAFYLGRIAFEQGRFQEAYDMMQGSLPREGEPSDFGIPFDRMYAALALTLQKLNRPEEAKEAWNRVLKLIPKDAKALAALKELNRRFPAKKSRK